MRPAASSGASAGRSVSVLTNAAAEPERLSREEIDALYDVLKGLEEKEHG